MSRRENGKREEVGNPSNDASEDVAMSAPYVVRATIVGVCPILFHAWSCDAVAEKAAAAKGSKQKKTDNVESYVYRDENDVLCVPGEYVRQAIIHAAKFRQDPRSPRKSAMDLFKAAIVPLSTLCPISDSSGGAQKKEWDYLDRRRVVVQRNAVTRQRPAFRKGYQIECDLQVLLPEYVPQDVLHEALVNAGRLVGLADFRPTFGRFRVTRFERIAFDDEAQAVE